MATADASPSPTPSDYYYSYDYNESLVLPEVESDGLQAAIPVVYFLVFFVGFLGNVFVLLVLRRGRGGASSGRLVDTFVRHLAAADLAFVLTLPLWAASAAAHHRWDFTEPLCRLSSFAVAVNRCSNVAFLACMSADRYLAVVRQLDSRLLRSGCCVRLTCALVWALSLALGAPALVFRHVNQQGVCTDPEGSRLFQAYSVALVLLAFVVPVGVILLCYGAICLHLQRHCSLALAPRARARRTHTLKIVFAIVAAFVVSWLPFSVCRTALSAAALAGVELDPAREDELRRALLGSSCLAFFNSCANPAIYLLLDRHFQRRAASCVRHACLGGSCHGDAPLDSLSTPTLESQSSTHTRVPSLNLKTREQTHAYT